MYPPGKRTERHVYSLEQQCIKCFTFILKLPAIGDNERDSQACVNPAWVLLSTQLWHQIIQDCNTLPDMIMFKSSALKQNTNIYASPGTLTFSKIYPHFNIYTQKTTFENIVT